MADIQDNQLPTNPLELVQRATEIVLKAADTTKFEDATKVFGMSTGQFALSVAGIATLAQAYKMKMEKSADTFHNATARAERTQRRREALMDDEEELVGKQKGFWAEVKKSWDKNVDVEKKDFSILSFTLNNLMKLIGRFLAVFAIAEIFAKIITNFKQLEVATVHLVQQLGLVKGEARSLYYQAIALHDAYVQYGVSLQDVVEIQSSLFEALRGRPLKADLTEAAVRISKIYNLSTDTAGMLVGAAKRWTDLSAKGIENVFYTVGAHAKSLGFSSTLIMKNLASWPEAMKRFNVQTKIGRENLSKALVVSEKLGTNIENLVGFSDQFLDMNKTIETAARLQQLGVNIPAIDLLRSSFANDPAAMVQMISSKLKQAIGPNIDFSDKGTQLQLSEIADAFGLSLNQIEAILQGKSFNEAVKSTAQQALDLANQQLSSQLTSAGVLAQIENILDVFIRKTLEDVYTFVSNELPTISALLQDKIYPAVRDIADTVKDIFGLIRFLKPGFKVGADAAKGVAKVGLGLAGVDKYGDFNAVNMVGKFVKKELGVLDAAQNSLSSAFPGIFATVPALPQPVPRITNAISIPPELLGGTSLLDYSRDLGSREIPSPPQPASASVSLDEKTMKQWQKTMEFLLEATDALNNVSRRPINVSINPEDVIDGAVKSKAPR